MVSLTRSQDFEREKQAAYDRIDIDGFGYWTVFTAGAGFLTGAYDVSTSIWITQPLLNLGKYRSSL